MTNPSDSSGAVLPKVVSTLPHARRSDRVPIELAIQVSGTDGQGRSFMEDTGTAIVSRHGAKILLSRTLAPEQELTVRCVKTRKESDVRVVGQIGGGPGGFFYGIELLNHELNLWGIEFPPMTDSERAVARALMECGRCQTQELVYFDEFEAEVFEANQSLSRRCKRCSDSTLWKQSAPTSSTEPAAERGRTENERKDIRISLKMQACIRSKEFGEEAVTTENISCGGLRFKSANRYAPGMSVEVAIPYTRGATNVFASAQIVHAENLPAEGLTLYGVANVHQLRSD